MPVINRYFGQFLNRNSVVLLLAVGLFADQSNACKGRCLPGSSYYTRAAFVAAGLYGLYWVDYLLGIAIYPETPDTPESLKQAYSEDFGPGVTIYATAILRFPHMLSDLMDQREILGSEKKPNILVLGAGVFRGAGSYDVGPECPFVHEIAAVFPNSHIEIVDLDPQVSLALKNSRYRAELQLNNAKALVKNDRNFMRFRNGPKRESAQHSQRQLEKLLAQMPLELNSLLDSGLSIDIKETYFEFHEPKKYDFIVATKSFIYPFARESASDSKMKALVEKYLEALNPNGKLYVDAQTFKIIEGSNLLDETRFDYRVIEHTSSYLKRSECADKAMVPDDYVGCLNAKNGQRVNTTEDIVVIFRKK